MKSLLFAGALLLVPAVVQPASAAGCIKGAIVGGVLGHMAGHGGVGAAAGCVVGRHQANKRTNAPVQPQGQPADPGRR